MLKNWLEIDPGSFKNIPLKAWVTCASNGKTPLEMLVEIEDGRAIFKEWGTLGLSTALKKGHANDVTAYMEAIIALPEEIMSKKVKKLTSLSLHQLPGHQTL